MMPDNQELEARRILAEYERRDRALPPDYYALHRPANLFAHQEQQRWLLQCLQRTGMLPLAERHVLEVGCGLGDWLQVFQDFGASQENLAGIELGSARAELAARRLPEAEIRGGDATHLPWSDASFDIVFQRMMFTSILDATARRAAADEIVRVVRPEGVIIWVDFFVNPFNPHVHCLGRSDVRKLFPGWKATLYRTTLAPPIARRVVQWSWGLARFLEGLRVFNTFYFGFLRRVETTGRQA